MRVYVASKSKHWPFWAALRVAGIPIHAGWIDAEFNRTGEEPNPDAWARHWETCCREAAAADVTLMYAGNEERQLARQKQTAPVVPGPFFVPNEESPANGALQVARQSGIAITLRAISTQPSRRPGPCPSRTGS